MLQKIGLAALAVLVASEAFAFSEAVLYPLTALLHLGAAAQKGSFAVAGLLGAAAGWWILQSALAQRGKE